MQIAFAGDVYVPHRMTTLPKIGPTLQAILRRCDAVVVNFEAPLDIGASAKSGFKTGPALRQNPGTLRYLAGAGVTAVGLANNHAADFGEETLQQTAEAADALGLQITGLWQAAQLRTVELRADGLSARILAFAEQEWSGDATDRTRIAVLDLVEAAGLIEAAKQQANAVVVTLHGNNEHSPLPNPAFARQARFLIDCGADAVIAHHAHRISGTEIYRGRPIFYGLGNFQFCTPAPNAHWHDGLLAVLTLQRSADGVVVTSTSYPVSVNPSDYTTELALVEKAEKIGNDMAALTQIIVSPQSLEAHFDDFVAQSAPMYDEFLNPFAGSNRMARLLGRAWVNRVVLKRGRQAMMINALRCDAHRQAMTRHLMRRLDGR